MTKAAPALLDYLEQGHRISAKDQDCLFEPGRDAGAFLIVTKGAVRVEQTNTAGRTVVLYRVHAGDSCVLTTTGLLSGRPYSGYGYAEGAVEATAIPAERFRQVLAQDPQFQDLVFRGFAQRVGELTDVIDDLLLHRTDQRLARWLAAAPDAHVTRTQQALAQELGTAREVVSRSLKAFERRGWIALGRGVVDIRNAEALRRYAMQSEM